MRLRCGLACGGALAACLALVSTWPAAPGDAGDKKADDANLVQDPSFVKAGDDPKTPAHFSVKGDAEWVSIGGKYEFAPNGIAFYPWLDLDGDGKHAGSVSQDVTGFEPGRGKWFRFSFRGLAENNFAVAADGLLMRVDFFGKKGADSLDGVSRKIYPLVEEDRAELAENGKFRKGGGAVWKTYVLDFMLPFNEIDLLRLAVEFRDGASKTDKESAFFVTEFSLTPLPDPADQPKVSKGPKGEAVAPSDLIPLGGRWYYRPEKKGQKPDKLTIDSTNADRLYYMDDRLTNPFADNMTAWLRKGYLDLDGKLVDEDRFVPDNVVIEFNDDKTMIVHARNLPNHPTAVFPAPPGSGDRNPSYIQEHDYSYYIPLQPTRNPKAVAMNADDSNRALPMGPTAIAINGVVFYNPFDAGMRDATDLMDRCCGHPSPDNRYHYHKYPVCVKSPFVDEGDAHSPIIGFAFDGLPIYGPYESKGMMAKDCKENPLNKFNSHYDEVRGWHYHATPGKFPYVIGGYWGVVDARNFRRGPQPPGPGEQRRGLERMKRMAIRRINADKPHLWKADVAGSVDQFNQWFMRFAPEAFRSTRLKTTEHVKAALLATNDLRALNAATLRANPGALPTLRMCTAPPLAVDRLVGLAGASKNLVGRMEQGKLPTKMQVADLDAELTKLCRILSRLLDRDIFPWLDSRTDPTDHQRDRASTIVADRLCSAVANPIVRNAQEQRQLTLIGDYLDKRGYRKQAHPPNKPLTEMEPGTYTFRMNLAVGQTLKVNIPVDVVIQPKRPRKDRLPILIEAKSAGDFTNTNKRRKEEATKIHQLHATYGATVAFVLFLCGYFGSDYLGYEAAEGLDWVWEHRIEDLEQLGL